MDHGVYASFSHLQDGQVDDDRDDGLFFPLFLLLVPDVSAPSEMS
jgi:hypothetical protein